MRLCVSAVLVLLLALTRAGADPLPVTPESKDCSQLRTITDRNEVLGRFYFIAGYTDNDIIRSLLEHTNNFWGDMTLTKDGLYAEEYSNVNGTCLEFRFSISVDGETCKSSTAGMSHEFKLHNFTRTLSIMDLHASMTNVNAMIQSLHLDPSLAHGQHSTTARCYYLISKEQEVSEAELQLFKEQARCAGFTGEPSYVHKKDHEYCTEMESVLFNPDPECIKLDKLDTITDKTQVVGPVYFMAAFIDNDALKNLMGLTTSIWGEFTLSEAGFHIHEFSKMNGTCLHLNYNVIESGETSKITVAGVMNEFKFRSLTSTSTIMDVRMSSPNILPMLEILHIDPSVIHGQTSVKTRGYFLISKVPEVNDADIQLFRKYAKCAFFPDEPVLLNKGDGYCTELESVPLNPEPECIKLDKLDTITDKTQVVGPFYFMAAFMDNAALKNLMGLTTSIWGEITLSEAGLHIHEFSKINGTCLHLNYNVTKSGEMSKVTVAGVMNELKFRSLTSTSRIMDVRMSSSNILPLLEILHIDPSVIHGQTSIKTRGYFLISNVPEVNEADIQLFRKYAKCAFFPDEPVLLNKGDGYCTELESVPLNPDPECIKLDKLDTITDKTQVVGPFYFMAAFIDNDALKNLMGLTTSIWGEITLSEAGLHIHEFSKM